MSIKFPPVFQTYWKMAGIKAAFVTEAQPKHPGECSNCGGIGTLTTFCATQGPFDNPPGGKLIAHFGNGKWWGGANYSAICPVCNSTGKDPEYKSSPVRANPIKVKEALLSLSKMDTGQTEPIQDDAYTPSYQDGTL